MLQFYAGVGQSDAVIQGGREFLVNFPNAPQRTTVSLLMADAYARKDDTKSEFAIYGAVLKELAAQAQNVPLGSIAPDVNRYRYTQPANNVELEEENEAEFESGKMNQPRGRASQAFQINPATTPSPAGSPTPSSAATTPSRPSSGPART